MGKGNFVCDRGTGLLPKTCPPFPLPFHTPFHMSSCHAFPLQQDLPSLLSVPVPRACSQSEIRGCAGLPSLLTHHVPAMLVQVLPEADTWKRSLCKDLIRANACVRK